jgi:para-nitrobenzyl esterase
MMNRRAFMGSAAMAASALVGTRWNRILAAVGDAKAVPGPTVETSMGKVRALLQDKIAAFKGVPYGSSTSGAARFLPPAKVQSWTGVRDAFELGHRSPQTPAGLIPEFAAMDRSEPTGEDCLCLNIWTPGPGNARKRPTMVWLHGGGYSTGSAGFICYDGANLARKHDVVVVGVNHRLNVFGYMYLAELGGEKYAQSSNLGMLDIIAALEWVRDNILAFGGDPGNVTLFGQSGGGGKVSTLMAMPSAQGLYHRAIVESASAIKGVTRSDATESAQKLLAQMGLEPGDIDKAQHLPTEQLLAAMGEGGPAGNQALRLAPVVDGRTLPKDPFDPVAPEMSSNIPLLIGSVETEVTFFPGQQLDPIDDASLHRKVKETAHTEDAQADRLIAVYRKGRPGITNTDLYLILASDATFRRGVLTEAERKATAAKAPVYMYYFTWRTRVREGKLRSFHTLEIPFVFENVDLAKSMTGSGEDRYELSDKISSAWVAFARSGNPNHKRLPNWPAFNNTQRATMILNDDCKVVNDPNGEERRMLRNIQTVS